MATLKDIAEELSLSKAVVSRVLNGKPDVWASPATKERIFRAAGEMGYRPSATARALSMGRTMQFGIIVGQNASQPNIRGRSGEIDGFLSAAQENGYHAALLPLLPGDAGASQLQNWIEEKICDGFFLFSEHLGAQELAVLSRCSLPRVIVGDPDIGEDTLGATIVDYDNFAYAHDAVTWLQSQGHQHIAWNTVEGEANQPHCVQLRSGYAAALKKGPNPELAMIWPHGTHDRDLIAQVQRKEATALIVRGMHTYLRWVTVLLSCGYSLPQDFTLLALISETEFHIGHQGGLWHYGAICAHRQRLLGRRAAEALLLGVSGKEMPTVLTIQGCDEPNWGQPLVAA